MAITPADIQAQTFSEAKRGYDPAEVDVFLETLSTEVDAMLNKIVDLKTRLTTAEEQLAQAQAQLAAAPAATVAAPVQPAYSATERQISAALIAAQQTADRIVAEANDNAERIAAEADTKAREVIRQALAEKQKELEEIDRLKASREEFKSEYIKLVQRFMDEAQNSFPADLLGSNKPTGQESYEPPAAQPDPAPVVADPFAPLPNFATDDLD